MKRAVAVGAHVEGQLLEARDFSREVGDRGFEVSEAGRGNGGNNVLRHCRTNTKTGA